MFNEIPEGTRILTAKHINALVSSKALIEPFQTAHLASCSYDMSAGGSYVVAGHGGAILNTSAKPLILEPGSYAGVMSREQVRIPPNIYVLLGPKRKLSYDGIILLSGSVIDPGYEGHLLFVLFNSSGRKRTIFPGKKLCCATFFQLSEAVPNPLGPDPSLASANFPGEFLDSMANMELPSMVELSRRIEELRNLERRVLQLEETYTNVAKPVKELIEAVGKISNSVDQLTKEGQLVLGKLKDHDDKIGDIKSESMAQKSKVDTIWWVVSIVMAVLLTGTISWWMSRINQQPGSPQPSTPPSATAQLNHE